MLSLKFRRFAPMTESRDLPDWSNESAGAGDAMEEFVMPERRKTAKGFVDRRAHPRYEVDAWAEVMVQDGSMLFRGRLLDISHGGCYVETEARLRLAPGTLVEMVFRVAERVLRC